jgi:hypothetical protein
MPKKATKKKVKRPVKATKKKISKRAVSRKAASKKSVSKKKVSKKAASKKAASKKVFKKPKVKKKDNIPAMAIDIPKLKESRPKKRTTKHRMVSRPWKKTVALSLMSGILFMVMTYILGFLSPANVWYVENFPGLATIPPLSALMSSFIGGAVIGCLYVVFNSALIGPPAGKGAVFGFKVWLLTSLPWLITTLGLSPCGVWFTDLIEGLISFIVFGAIIGMLYDRC